MSKRPQNITSNTDDEEKKAIRRDNERQRRKQMAFLNASLRSELPLEMIKVKRLQCLPVLVLNTIVVFYDFTSSGLYNYTHQFTHA